MWTVVLETLPPPGKGKGRWWRYTCSGHSCLSPAIHPPGPRAAIIPWTLQASGASVGVVEEHWPLLKPPALGDFVFVKKRVRFVVKGGKVCCSRFSSGEVRLVYCYFLKVAAKIKILDEQKMSLPPVVLPSGEAPGLHAECMRSRRVSWVFSWKLFLLETEAVVASGPTRPASESQLCRFRWRDLRQNLLQGLATRL